jgi:hypothetical protein
MQAITTIGLGIAKSVFQIQGRSASTLPRQPRRADFLALGAEPRLNAVGKCFMQNGRDSIRPRWAS